MPPVPSPPQADLGALKRKRARKEAASAEAQAEAADALDELFADIGTEGGPAGAPRENQADAADVGSPEQEASDALDELFVGFGTEGGPAGGPGEQKVAAPSEEAEAGGESYWGAWSSGLPPEDVEKGIADALRSGDIHAALNLFRSEKHSVPEASYLEALRLVPEQRELAGAAQELLNDYLARGFDASQGCSLAVQNLLQVGALRAAVGVFLTAERRGATLTAEQYRGIFRVLGSFGQLKPGTAHIRRMREVQERDESEDLVLFNALFSGLALRSASDSLQLSEMLLQVMVEADVRPSRETLNHVLEVQLRVGLPDYLTSLGRALVEFKNRHGVEPGSYTMLVVSIGHLRRGDLDAAYRWFLASRLVEDPVQLGRPEAVQAREYISELARALAISGYVRQLLRLLWRLAEDGGWLPASASSVSIAGWTSGRTLATAWMEPPAEVLRRRAIWASDPSNKVKVTCAEQFTWPDLDGMRHEVYQWSPYLAPDVKPERAWVAPLRAEDTGALGLARDWMGESPAATAARERLGEQALPGSGAASIKAALDRALQLRPPQPRERVPGTMERGVSPLVLPTPRSWRAHHSIEVHRSFLTPARTRATTKEEFAEMLLNDPGTRRLKPRFKEAAPITFNAERLEETLAAAPEDARQALSGMSSKLSLASREELNDVLQRLGLSDREMAKSDAVELAQLAAAHLQGELTALPVSDEAYEEYIRGMSDEELEKLWRRHEAPVADGGLLGSDLVAAVSEELRRERAEDEEIEGSAADELRLALEISSTLCKLGSWPTSADLRALCAAAHAANEPELAAELMRAMADELHSAFAEGEQEETDDAERPQGPASEALVGAMELGGWEPSSSRAFLAGKLLLPQRAGGEGLGGLLTRYLDPLLGHSRDDPAVRDAILAHLSDTWQGEDTSPEVVAAEVNAEYEAEIASMLGEASEAAAVTATADAELSGEGAQIWIKRSARAGSWEVLSEAAVLRTLLQRPIEADSWLLSKLVLEGAAEKRILKALGLPAPPIVKEVTNILQFARSVWAAASKRRTSAMEAVTSDARV